MNQSGQNAVRESQRMLDTAISNLNNNSNAMLVNAEATVEAVLVNMESARVQIEVLELELNNISNDAQTASNTHILQAQNAITNAGYKCKH